MMENTFRLEYRTAFSRLNALRVPRPLRVLAFLLMGLLAVTVAGLVTIPWVQNAQGIGRIITFDPTGSPQTITAPVKGRLKQWHVFEGSTVRKGDLLLEIVDNDPRYIERLELELRAAQQKFSVERAAAETAKLDYQRRQNLYKKGLASRLDLEKAQINYNNYLAKQAAAAASLAKVETNRSRQESQSVRAPADGMLVQIRSGDSATFIKEGEVLAHFIPAQTVPVVEMYVKGLDAPLVRVGARVRLQFEGWPAIQFSGWPAMSIGTFGGIVKSVDPVVSANGKFRVLIVQDPAEKWPSPHFLRFGTRVQGWVLLNTVRSGYELWRNLNNFPPLPPQGVSMDYLALQDYGTEDSAKGGK